MKNYLKVIFLILIVLVFCILIYFAYNTFWKYRIQSSVLKDYEVTLDTIDDETSGDYYFVYVSYTGDEIVYKNEAEIKSYLKKQNLLDKLKYINSGIVYMTQEDFVNEINTKYDLDIEVLPVVILVKDGKAYTYYDSRDGIINEDAFAQIIDMYLR